MPSAGQRKPRNYLSWWVRIPRWYRRAVAVVVVLTVSLTVAAAGYVVSVDLPPDPVPPQASVLYYRDGRTVLARIGTTDRTDVGLDKIPLAVRQAFLAAEDRGFYGHSGVSVRGLLRALWTNIVHDDGQGASTITQQYVRNAYLTQERTVSRKSREAALALKVEHRFSKDEILSRYLNTIYFGRGAYGIEAAARAYFGTGVDRLTGFQGAVLAAMVKDPTRGDPAADPEWAQTRWKWILRAMSEQGWLPEGTADRTPYPAVAPESVTASTIGGPAGLIADRVEDELLAAGISRQQIRTGGLRVTTTIDATAQAAATGAIGTALRGQPKELRTALVALDPQNGGVRAYYGGDRGRGYFDDALAARPPASTFKPVVLAAAEEQNIGYQSLYNGTSPRQFTDRGGAPLYNQDNLQCPICPLDIAMVHSLNTPYYALAEQIGPASVRKLALRLGVPEKYGKQPTLVDVKGEPAPGKTRSDIALGRYPVAPADLATLYATLAGGGLRTERHFVETVTRANGSPLFKHQSEPVEVLSSAVAADVGAVLAQVVKHDGPIPGVPAAAKTGSQQWSDTGDSSDAWTAGWASGLAAVTWVGRDKPGPIRLKNGKAINGDGMPYEIWRKFLAGALRGRSPALAPAAEVGRPESADLRTLGPDAKRAPGVVYPGPQKGDLVDKSKATGSWQERVARLTAELELYATKVPDFSVAVTDRRTGRRFDFRGDRRYEAASVVKVELLAALLLQAQVQGRQLTAKERTRAEKMIKASDNDAAVKMYAAVGGADGLRLACHELGLDDTDADESFGLTRTTAKDQNRMIAALTAADSPLKESSRDYILQLMASVNADQSWGVSATAFSGERTSLKNGWLSRSTEQGRWIVNSTGRISGDKTDTAVTVLSHGHPTQADGIKVVEQVAALTRSYLGW
ncbi:transglycosylase domain-containing protein [Actinoplanes friuliensis]|uniref:Glycosyl transferase family protein n=1 Tax=Actinoplanes friuliensis DSM 7358 TaxID=1246995 RepID=U5VWG9_9ACTN|nr:transglycosylase domain-containing protein [Actinoplanes friuliensis]AGZ41353.1 glycosyl transferase family protein [Actinoplanes friuliensis DSM 7358]